MAACKTDVYSGRLNVFHQPRRSEKTDEGEGEGKGGGEGERGRRNELSVSMKEGAKRVGPRETGQENGDHNVILTEITPPCPLRDNKFATLSRRGA